MDEIGNLNRNTSHIARLADRPAGNEAQLASSECDRADDATVSTQKAGIIPREGRRGRSIDRER